MYNRTLTELFHQYKGARHLVPEIYEQVTIARRRRPEVLNFCQRIYLKLRRLIYGEGIPTYGGDFEQQAKKRRKEAESRSNSTPASSNPPPVADQPSFADQPNVASMFEEEVVETPASEEPMDNTNKYVVVSFCD